jgi:hypothetical protein
MQKETKILVFCPIYNEEKHLEELINSVLSQSFHDFTFLISDNHSTDRSEEIIKSIIDNRIVTIRPPTHLTALDHVKWLNNWIDREYPKVEFTAFVGGHDFWTPNYLEVLHQEMIQNNNCILAYSDTFEISATGQILRKYPINVCTNGVLKPLRPIYVLNGLTHDIAFGGLWREKIRRRVMSKNISCAALDHLLIAKASLYGDVSYVQGTIMGLRQVEGAANLDIYYQKHLGLKRGDTVEGIADFKKQLEFAVEIQVEAVAGVAFYEQKPILDSLRVAMFNTYILRYIRFLSFFDDGMARFFADKEMQKVLQCNGQAANHLDKFIKTNALDF